MAKAAAGRPGGSTSWIATAVLLTELLIGAFPDTSQARSLYTLPSLSHLPPRLSGSPGTDVALSWGGHGGTDVDADVATHGDIAESALALPALTARGMAIRRVLVVSLVKGGCRGDDWRGDLPRHIMSYLPKARAVLLNAKNETHWVCSECASAHAGRHSYHHSDCQAYMGLDGKAQPADLLLVIGTGVYAPCESTKYAETCRLHKKYGDITYMYPELRGIFSSGYVDSNTLTVHFPIRKLRSIRKLPFSVVVGDSDFVKPLASESRDSMKHLCAREHKSNDLLYVGRYQESKGQLIFLETVDPNELEGYHLHFYGSNMNQGSGYHVRMQEVARARNITVTIHPPVEKAVLLKHYCRAVGQIHYASGDNNPRAAYEGLYAGNPLFISFESKVNQELYSADFVVGVKYASPEFSASFKHYMRLVRNQLLLQGRIQTFVDAHFSPDQIYRRLCVQMGICSASEAADLSSIGPFVPHDTATNAVHRMVERQAGGREVR
mmetsp:Transcript_25771/g.72132  ORF Transcript_25771/g.72132 Transcript_25771/m.72132 type:complete len:495 (+) Transcript_25771:357-1841(+)|eukprot:CAMPEP_0117664064 /NCGR_PEP_ID=MMETSP0804-20121206/8988_1 /TAXON_ID=1074897 /ORGANISM="Tetraselmis astigmatica, Strain CCMP880" /LENGTH=494 /DNA_ID=CAMNT_0005471207 /DNA_START=293 /DNA_END=1777 /DNA_ORIENTATION=+